MDTTPIFGSSRDRFLPAMAIGPSRGFYQRSKISRSTFLLTEAMSTLKPAKIDHLAKPAHARPIQCRARVAFVFEVLAGPVEGGFPGLLGVFLASVELGFAGGKIGKPLFRLASIDGVADGGQGTHLASGPSCIGTSRVVTTTPGHFASTQTSSIVLIASMTCGSSTRSRARRLTTYARRPGSG